MEPHKKIIIKRISVYKLPGATQSINSSSLWAIPVPISQTKFATTRYHDSRTIPELSSNQFLGSNFSGDSSSTSAFSGGPSSTSAFSGGPSSTIAFSGGPSSTSAFSGGPSSTSAFSGGPLSTIAFSGGPLSTIAFSGGPSSTSAFSGGPLSTIAFSGGPSSTSAFSGGPSSTSAFSGGPSSTSNSATGQISNVCMTQTSTKTDEAVFSVVGGRKRYMHKCPECTPDKKVFDLPRHLRDVHSYSRERARNYVQHHGMRGRNIQNTIELKSCGYDGCEAKVKRLDLHLKKVHKVYIVKPKINKRVLIDENERVERHTSTEAPNTFMKLLLKTVNLYLNHKRLSVKKRLQHANRCKTIFELVRPKSVWDLIDDVKLNSFFVDRYQNGNWKANTVRHYILSFQKFLEYLYGRNLISMTESEKERLSSLIKELPDWRDEYKDYIKQEKNDLWKKRKQMLHNQDDVKKYYESDEYKNFQKLILRLKKSSKPMTLIREQHNSLLRCIITSFHLRCAKRAGIFGQITVEQYKNKEKEKDEFVVNVKEHKTSGCYGDSSCVFNTFQCDCIDTYLEKVRPQVAKKKSEDHLFLKFNGTKLTNTDVSNFLKKSWRAAGIDKNTNSTVFRESIITQMYRNAPTEKEKQNAALLLDHDMSTAYKQYNIVLKTEKAVSAAKYASTLMKIDDIQDSKLSLEALPEKMDFSPEYPPKKVTAASEYSPEKVTAASEYSPEKVTAASEYSPEKVTAASEYTPEKVTAASEYSPEKVTAASEYSPEKVTAASEYSPEKVTAASEYSPEKVTAASEYSPKKVTATPITSKNRSRFRRKFKYDQVILLEVIIASPLCLIRDII